MNELAYRAGNLVCVAPFNAVERIQKKVARLERKIAATGQ
jgi:hypothetical protein